MKRIISFTSILIKINGQTFTVWSACVVSMVLTFIMCVARLKINQNKNEKIKIKCK